MAQISPLESLRASLRGEILTPVSAGYEKAVVAWNWDHKKRPQAIFQVLGASDVQKVLKFISTSSNPPLPFTVRGGGHSIRCLCDGYVIDLSKMRSCRVDVATKTIRVDGGALLSDVYKEAAAHDLFLPAGIVSHTGVAGLGMFGGFGWLSRQFGLTCDQILEVDIVTADGEIRVVNKDEYPDLYWAIRGAGPCFGVVTSFKFQLVPSTCIYAGNMVFPPSRCSEVFEAYRQYTIADDKFSRKDSSSLVATMINGEKTLSFVPCYHGTEEEAKDNFLPFVNLGPSATAVQQLKTVDWFSSLDPAAAPSYWYKKGVSVTELVPEMGSIIAAAIESAPLGLVLFLILPLGGKVNEVPPDATAYAARNLRFVIVIQAGWTKVESGDEMKKWGRALTSELSKFKADTSYINFEGDTGAENNSPAVEFFATNLPRLQELKKKYDPAHYFPSI